MALIGKSISNVYLAEVTRYKEDYLRISRLIKNISYKLFLIGIIPCCILFVYGGYIFSVIFGEVWFSSGKIMSRLAFFLIIELIVHPIFSTLEVIGTKGDFFVASF